MADVSSRQAFASIDSLAVLGALWLIVAQEYPTIVGARYWASASAITAAGIAAFVLVPRSALGVAIALGDSLIVLGACLAWAGVRRYLHRRPASVTIAGVVAAAVAGLVLSSIVFDAVNVRTIVLSLGFGVPTLLAGVELLLGKKPSRALGTYVAGWAFVACAGFAVARVGLVLTSRSEVIVVSEAAIQAPVMLQMMFLGVMVSNFALVLVTIEQLQDDLMRLVVTDALTGAANRRSFLEHAARERARSVRSRRPFAILMMDIDHFKSINDAHGHDAGDAVLKAFVKTASQCLRPSDVFARYGGEEFCALLPGSGAAEALTVAERIRVALRGAAVPWGDTIIPSTVSIGIAEYEPNLDLAQLISKADAALYCAKEEGRDRVVVSSL